MSSFSLDFMGFPEVSLEFIFQFPWFSSISQGFGPAALPRKKWNNSYAFSMVAALIFLPGHSKNWISMNIIDSDRNNWDFHEIWWNLGSEWDFYDSGGSLAGPGWTPWYSYRNIEVSEPPRTTTIIPKQRKSQNSSWNRSFPVQNMFFHLWSSKNCPRTLRL